MLAGMTASPHAPFPPPTPDSRSAPPPEPARTPLAASAWLAAVGTVLVVVASIAVAAARWGDIPGVVKLAALWVVAGACLAVARSMRDRLPLSSRTLDDLARLVAAVATAATALAAGGRWPSALVAGGAVGAVLLLDASRAGGRGRGAIRVAGVAAGATCLAGVAGLTPLPTGVLVAAGALVAWATAARRVAAIGAALAALAPLAGVPVLFDVGPGTLRDLGVRGAVLAWAAPLAGVVAAAVLAALAHARRSTTLAIAAATSLCLNAVVGLTAGDFPAWFVVVTPCVAYALWELALLAADRDPWWRELLDQPAEVTEGVALASVAPWTALAIASVHVVGLLPATLALGPAAVGCGLATALVRSPRAHRATSRVLSGAAAVLAGACALQLVGAPPFVGAIVALAACVVLVWTAPAANGSTPSRLAAASIGAQTMAAVVGVAWFATPWPVAMAAWAALALGLVALACGAAADDVIVVPFVLAGLGVAGRSPLHLVTGRAAWGTVHAVAALAVLTIALALRDRRWWHVTAVLCPMTGAMAAAAAGAGAHRSSVTLLVVGIVVAGAAFVGRRFTPVDTAGLALVTLAAAVAHANGHQLVAWLALTVAGVLVTLHGLALVSSQVSAVGCGLTLFGGAGVAVTSGAVRVVVDHAEQRGVRPGDLAVAGLTVLLATAGCLAHRLRPALRSWSTWGPAIALASIHLVATIAADPEQSGRLLVALAGGCALVAVGGWRRLAAPLVGGTALLGAVLAMAAWSALADVTVWAWLAAAGAGLIALSVALERAGGVQQSSRRIVEVVWERYG
jgi:hypothetical protein